MHIPQVNNILKDAYGRQVSYVRFSVTDRCNFRCLYCANSTDFDFIPHAQILQYEEMLTVLEVLVTLGVNKVRFTGGEPFVRKDFLLFLTTVRKRFPHLDIRITTNASQLSQHISQLESIGVSHLNISLDTFNPNTFATLTHTKLFEQTMQGLEAALGSSISVKINSVALKGINDCELPQFLSFAMQHGITVRFIEYMPMGGRAGDGEDLYWSATDILEEANKIVPISLVTNNKCTPNTVQKNVDAGPAKLYQLDNSQGYLGVITPVSCQFCHDCNRLRITSDGKFRACLFDDAEFSFRHLLQKAGSDKEALLQLLTKVISEKPLGYTLLEKRTVGKSISKRGMSAIGG